MIKASVSGECSEYVADLVEAVAEQKAGVAAVALRTEDEVARFARLRCAAWFINAKAVADAQVRPVTDVRDHAFHFPRHRLAVRSPRDAETVVRAVATDFVDHRLRETV